MRVYIYDIDEHDDLDYRTPACAGDFSKQLLARFNGLKDFDYHTDTGEWETDHYTFKFWERRLDRMEKLNSKQDTYRQQYGDEVINAIVERAGEYSDIDEVIECNEDWLDRLGLISTQEILSKDKVKKQIAYEDELAAMNLENPEWLDKYIGMGDTTHEALVDYIKKSEDN